ncbi:pyrroline-5-carboxylate reductase [Eikenella sp. S3360]|uniref:Pyrroline-5-carboxylate reductase n=1 Tax=Eikenella glucosivorans TaxID=2766967 RepID=A0ABS0N848_9NEIS|nr:alpha/beta hydrolase-fold protein [Eikenella glucosivorans]MBH5328477.1 pyrroline-5-carboxylate reductase [Eikenella glucosivorans]
MKKTAAVAAALLLAACTAPNPVSGSPAAQNTQNPAWDKQYGGADKSYDHRLLALRDRIAPRFEVLAFQDPQTGKTMQYNLYTPKNLEPNRKYPLVMFIADASTAGKGVRAPLMQGYGGIIWATDEAQAKHPAFVLVPSYTETAVNDQWQTTDEVGMTLRLVHSLLAEKPIDADRVYTTGQSMGGMISFYLNSIEPELFAASMFVGSQWDISVLKPLEQAKFIYTVSAGDQKASGGMAEVGEMLQRDNVPYAETEFSAKLPQAQQDAQVQKMLAQGRRINFIRFTPNTVVPEGSTHKGAEHMYSFDYAYLLEPARDWLMKQQRGR